MVEQVDKWIATLALGDSADTKGWSSPKNMSTYANYLTFDILGSLCFGKPFGLIDGKSRDILPGVIFVRLRRMQIVSNLTDPTRSLLIW